MVKSEFPIVYATDENYATYTAISLWSVLNKTSCKIACHIFDAGISDKAKRLLAAVAKAGGSHVEFHPLEPHFPPAECLSLRDRAYLARLLIPKLLHDYQRALYLDVDTVCVDDLVPLFNVSLEGKAIGAVRNLRALEKHYVATSPLARFYSKTSAKARVDADYYRTQLGLENPSDYINSGVVMMDLPRIKEQIGLDRFCDVEAASKLRQGDQDWLAKFGPAKLCYLHPKWNCYSSSRRRQGWALPPLHRQAFKQACEKPALVHFVGTNPWDQSKTRIGGYVRSRDPWFHAWQAAYQAVLGISA